MQKGEIVMIRRCFIFAAAELYGLYELPRAGDWIIAADAGYLHCLNAGITPDLLIGDFDSMPDIPFLKSVPHMPEMERVPVEKDDTDTMLAVKNGLSNGCKEFYIYGGTGGNRPDHTFANVQGLVYLRRHNACGILYDKCFAWTVIENETLEIPRTVNDGVLSVFSLGERATGVSLYGVHYPMDNGELTAEFPLGVSNHMTEARAIVTVQNGILLVGWELSPPESR